ncbi:MAG TPA: hypothetical protein VJR48_10350 [Ktedonobacterales bacterium]|nr:hypothetical protein [Ktedonobacterales bacterium]
MMQDWLERLRAFWSASRRNQITVLISAVVLVALIVGSISLLTTRGGASANAIAQATATSRQTATSAGPTPTTGPTATPLPTKPVNLGIVGGTEAGFTAVYGRPTGTGVDSGNNLPTVDYKGGGPIGGITIELDSTKSYVVGVVITPPQNTPFDATNLQVISPHFAPPDATYDSAAPITNGSNEEVGIFQLGHSTVLAKTIPESAFTDTQGQLVAAGTFCVQIYYIEGASGKLAYAITLRLGNQPATPGA